ncbi:Periplasmic serine protease (ClpP class) [Halanaeroarchaeum sp. HSR-CO]|uniref:S49 family peptidase n=1 Tax=Halanaeroarchaeum sp. HSR-CO TaxID=2866382 RepID=UPI00217D1A28|nr:S49 family peptidase [Halanaeroarchaeum sp. HSR-CO]UWG47555.1 Periplasmic serine protease (ClpP class) [Halanaeroarchaeum sp. HSR-CO]
MDILSRVRSASRSYTVIFVVALLVGAAVAPTAFSMANEMGEQTDTVAVIEVGSTIAEPTAAPVKEQLQNARSNDSIKAVVLKVNTPGGALSATESLALEVERTAEVMPVVVSVTQMAASGGYYVSAPADHIVANPSAMVGSVGVNFAYFNAGSVGTAIQSGPDKSGGYTEEEAIEMADMMVEGFYGTVLDHRGDKIELSKEELAYAKVYPSQKALHNGMIDEIGTLDTAIQRAADQAGLDTYEVVELDTTPDLTQIPLFSAQNDNLTSSERVEAMIDPAPGVETPVALAMYGTLPDEQIIVTTAGDASVQRVDTESEGAT